MMLDKAQEVQVGNEVFKRKKHESLSKTEKGMGGMGLGALRQILIL